ncbi:hypothetical protein FRC14_002282 [Serendipita sp. 396]|nr:hypothetical protein FRC14_002282 [Serendipita sp. 396]KAG8785039.1 hypothetical protein FRC15_002082 [Serendipita sp. 397]KAG8800770.1 hypothetical protein FRC16_002104 [Serendipita sp. 398]KAG8824569.1 hypothetical protein FRC19_001479 [Serendipita sp. 401]KAG8838950.1 hypothetical protein FRC18_001769 [Serendipita sp. 400]KAG8855763.1 hypothetical protein FRB91_001754 [Serendipita sp. 411]KAG8870674.1 hypothetical protein FRC20_011469 [Serendipita sp. 405]KAG9055739.1 hypothetical prot
MTQLPPSPQEPSPTTSTSSSEKPPPQTSPAQSPNPAANPSSNRKIARHRQKTGTPWCKAAIYTFIILILAYFWLSWTDPDQIALRKHAWDKAMERIRGKQVIYSSRYSKQYKYRPAASPVVTETLSDGRTKIHGGRPGDDIPIPKPTPTPSKKPQRKKKNKRKH